MKSIIHYIHIIILILSSLLCPVKAESPSSPLYIPLVLAGNFGELRANHFHSGLDFKTQGRIGIPIHSFDDGYISRIMVAPSGNGKALYINHPNGLTTVYLHLDHFTEALDDRVEEIQYKTEKYEVNYYFKPNEIKVSKGEIVAFSGNSGSSAGPHLHFEVRDTKTEEVFDPLFYFRNLIKDHIAPHAREIVISPMFYGGVVNGKMQKAFFQVSKNALKQTPLVWGKVALALKAFDSKDGVSNIFGVKTIRLFVDNELIFNSRVNRYAFKNTRYINSCIDYPEWKRTRSTYFKSFVEPGNKIEIFDYVKNGGVIDIHEERDYQIKYVLTDEYENSSELNFIIKGKKQEILPVQIDCFNKFFWDKPTLYKNPKVQLDIQPGVLYDDLCFNYSSTPSSKYFSDIHTIHNANVPLQTFCTLQIKLDVDTVADKSKYYLARLSANRPVYHKSEYKKGWIKGQIRDFGDYTVAVDRKAPAILPLKVKSRNVLEYRISDSGSGVESYKCTIDGKFALFAFTPTSGIIRCNLSPKHVEQNKNHLIKIVVRDYCGNESVYDNEFHW